MRKLNFAIKRLFDIIASAGALIVFTIIPVLIIVPIVIKLTSKGPAVYTQTRIGKKQKAV